MPEINLQLFFSYFFREGGLGLQEGKGGKLWRTMVKKSRVIISKVSFFKTKIFFGGR